MHQTYYLYNDPSDGLLTWIPWDNNEALQDGKMGGALSLSLVEADGGWPLIRYLIDDDTYRPQYVEFVQAVINGAFEPSRMIAMYQEMHDLIQPYVTGAEGENGGFTFLSSDGEFDAELSYLISHVERRCSAAQVYLDSQQHSR